MKRNILGRRRFIGGEHSGCKLCSYCCSADIVHCCVVQCLDGIVKVTNFRKGFESSKKHSFVLTKEIVNLFLMSSQPIQYIQRRCRDGRQNQGEVHAIYNTLMVGLRSRDAVQTKPLSSHLSTQIHAEKCLIVVFLLIKVSGGIFSAAMMMMTAQETFPSPIPKLY